MFNSSHSTHTSFGPHHQGEQNPKMLNQFQKPSTVTFKFLQKRFDKSGEIQDQHGQTIYRLVDEGEQHTFGFAKSYPLQIYRVANNTLVASLDWDDKPKKTKVEGLAGTHGKVYLGDGLVNEELKWKMPDGSQFEWDGIWGYPFRLLDYRIPQIFSITPVVAATYTPRPTKKDYTTIEVLRDALGVPNFLDYVIVTSLYLEYELHHQHSQQAANKIGHSIGEGIGSSFGGA